jgi:hypothetical protein
MAEDVETTEVEESSDSIWAKLGITDPDEQFEAEGEEAEAEAEKEDKVAKKLNSRVDDLEKKFRMGKLQEAKDKFLSTCDPLEADLFKTVGSDAKDPESLDHAITLVKEKAAQMKETMEKAEAEARDQVAKSWGVANPGQMAQPTDDEQKAQAEAIAKGDTKAGFSAIMGDDPFLQGRI